MLYHPDYETEEISQIFTGIYFIESACGRWHAQRHSPVIDIGAFDPDTLAEACFVRRAPGIGWHI